MNTVHHRLPKPDLMSSNHLLWTTSSLKPQNNQLTITSDRETQKILTIRNLKLKNVWLFNTWKMTSVHPKWLQLDDKSLQYCNIWSVKLQAKFSCNQAPIDSLNLTPDDALTRCRMSKEKTLTLKPKPFLRFFWFQSPSVLKLVKGMIKGLVPK